MSIEKRKIGIIGAGHVGANGAYSLIQSGIVDEIVMIDTNKDKALAQAVDLYDSTNYMSHRTYVKSGDYNDIKDAQLIIIAVGPLPADKTQTRMDILSDTIGSIKEITKNLKEIAYDGIILNISNPADVVTQYIAHILNYEKRKVISTSTTLDSARLRRVISEKLNVDQKSISAYVLGEHGESQMVAWSSINIGGLPLKVYEEKYNVSLNKKEICEKARLGGWTVLLGKGYTEFGIGASILEVVRAIIGDENKILPVSVYLDGEYGVKDVYASVPCIVNKNGISDIIELELNNEEKELFNISCEAIKNGFNKAKEL